MKRFEEIIETCTAKLKGDAELQHEVQLELCSHLETAADFYRGEGKTASEACELASRDFGDPEKIADRLLTANLSRLKWRARIRLAVKVLLLPLLLLGLWAAIDLRTASCFSLLNEFGLITEYDFRWLQKLEEDRDPNIAMLEHPVDPAEARRFYLTHRDDALYRATYLQSAASKFRQEDDEEQWTFLTGELRYAKGQEPENALFPYLLASFKLENAVEIKAREKDQTPEVTVLDQAEFDAALAEIRIGLELPYFNPYVREKLERLMIRPTNRDVLDLLQQVYIAAGINLPHLSRVRTLARVMNFQGKQLAEQGNFTEADFFLNAYKRLNRQLNDQGFFLIDQLVIAAIAEQSGRWQREVYAELKRPELLAESERQTAIAAAPRQRMKENRQRYDQETDRLVQRHAGLLAKLLLPALGVQITQADLRPELNLTYNVLDLSALAVIEIFWAAVIVFLLFFFVVFHRRGSRLLILPLRQFLMFLLLGIGLPLLLFWLLTRVDFLSRRDYAPEHNLALVLMQYVFLSVICPAWTLILYLIFLRRYRRNRGEGKLTFNLALGNLLPVLVLLLLCTGIIFRPLLKQEQRRLIREDRVISQPESESLQEFSRVEADLVRKMREENRAIYRQLLAEPIRLTRE